MGERRPRVPGPAGIKTLWVRPGAAPAPRFRAVTRRAAAGARAPAAARVWRNPREPESC